MPDRKPFVPLVDRVGEPWQRLVVALAGVALCGRVWVWGAPDCPRCPTEYHYCDRGWGVGYSVAVSNRRIRKVYDSAFRGGYFRQNWDRFHVDVVAQGIPAYRSYDMHVNVFATGAAADSLLMARSPSPPRAAVRKRSSAGPTRPSDRSDSPRSRKTCLWRVKSAGR
jgi:hypothetical protein